MAGAEIPLEQPLTSSSPYEPHSLGSSIYRLFSRGNIPPPVEPRSERLTSLAELHDAVKDEIPVSSEEAGPPR